MQRACQTLDLNQNSLSRLYPNGLMRDDFTKFSGKKQPNFEGQSTENQWLW